MSHENQIKILEGEEARENLDTAALVHLTNRVNKREIGDRIGLLRYLVGRSVDRLFGPGDVTRAVRSKIDPAFFPIEHMKGLRDRGHIAVAKDGDRIVGMAGFEHCGIDPKSGRNIYEVRRVGVRKNDEKRGTGGRLHKAVFDRMRLIDPQALILVEAWDQAIMNQCKKIGYKECDVVDGLVMKGYTEEEAKKRVPWYQEKGYKFFVYDPSKPKRSDAAAEDADSSSL